MNDNRMVRVFGFLLITVIILLSACSRKGAAPSALPVEKINVPINWDKVLTVSKTTPTLQVVVMPIMRRGQKIHDRVYQVLHELGADYVRYVPWTPYPRLAVAELEPPNDGKTSWDFSLIDPMTEDFVNATTGHSVILNFSTMPQWIFKTDKPVPYPADPEEVTWKYTQGTEFRDPSLKEAADYYGRLVSWYTQGGFTDEYGKRHESGHHYKIDYWEVLNEVESEHRFTPESYTHFYDAIVAAIRKVQPQMKFVAMALERPSMEPQYFEYFLNPKNHKPGTPLDMISYHFYAHPAADQDPELAQYSVFDQADGFFNTVRYVQTMRQGLSPSTMTDLDELGCNPANDNAVPHKPIPNSYWNLCGAVYAYDYGMSARLGVEVAGESQFLGYPSQYPSVSLLDWNTGQPNARFWVLKLLHDNFAPGDKVIQTNLRSAYIFAQAFVTPQGERKLLLINKRNRPFEVSIPEAQSSDVTYVDQTTAFQPPATAQLSEGRLPLSGFEVAVVKLPK